MTIEQKNQMVEQYINNLAITFNDKYPNIIDNEKINRAIDMFKNSTDDYDTIIEKINKLVEQIIQNSSKKSFDTYKEKHYDLNEFFDCRISNNTLHIHVVPKSIKDEIEKIGLRQYYKLIEVKLDDALSKIPEILNDSTNINIENVFAVSPLLRTSHAQDIFERHGFEVGMTTNEKFMQMFQNKRIGQAIISKEKFMQIYDKSSKEDIMTQNINKNINSDFFINILRLTWEQTKSISLIGKLIGEVYLHHIINKDGYNFENYIRQMSELYGKLYSKQISPEQFDIEKSKNIAIVIASRLDINTNQYVSENNMNLIKDYFLNEYVTNGYVAHSFPELAKESIMQNGLSSEPTQRSMKFNDIQEIQFMFMDQGVVAPLGGYPYYSGSGIYYEHDFCNVFQHAINSPEWFNWFTSSDHSRGFQSIENSPYILRNEEVCKINVMDLCVNSGLGLDQIEKVMQFYQDNYVKFSNSTLNVALISKKIVDKSNITKAAPNDMDLLSTINYVIKDKANQYEEHKGNVYYGTITSDNIKLTNIPDAKKIIHIEQYNRESKEHLLDPKTNLQMINRIKLLKSRISEQMLDKVEEIESRLLHQMADNNDVNQVENPKLK